MSNLSSRVGSIHTNVVRTFLIVAALFGQSVVSQSMPVLAQDRRDQRMIEKLEQAILEDRVQVKLLLEQLGGDHPRVKSVEHRIQINRKLIEELQKPSGTPTSPQKRSPPFDADVEDQQMERTIRKLAKQFRGAPTELRAELRLEIQVATEAQFEYRQKRRIEDFESLEQRVIQLKASHARRQANKAVIVQRRIDELLDPESDLNWDEKSATDPDVAANPSANDTITPLEDDSRVTNNPNRATTPARKDSDKPEATYNGMTLAEALRLAETERNPDRIMDAVLAFNHLYDDVDPTDLARATFHLLRYHGSESMDQSVHVILDASTFLLARLPSDVVVKVLLEEIPASRSRKPTQDFLVRFLRSLDSQPPFNKYFTKGSDFSLVVSNNQRLRISNMNQETLTDAVHQLRNEIRQNANRISDALVEVAPIDGSLNFWIATTALHVIHISDQPLPAFPKLVPTLEQVFNSPGRLNLMQEYPYRVELAKVLARNDLLIPEIVDFTEGMIRGEDKRYRLTDAIACYVAAAPHYPEGIGRLNELLKERWTAFEAFRKKRPDLGLGPTEAPLDGVNPQELLNDTLNLVNAFAEIGPLAKQAIPTLNEIATSPQSLKAWVPNADFVPAANFNSTKPTGPTLREIVLKTIKKIEEPKPE